MMIYFNYGCYLWLSYLRFNDCIYHDVKWLERQVTALANTTPEAPAVPQTGITAALINAARARNWLQFDEAVQDALASDDALSDHV